MCGNVQIKYNFAITFTPNRILIGCLVHLNSSGVHWQTTRRQCSSAHVTAALGSIWSGSGFRKQEEPITRYSKILSHIWIIAIPSKTLFTIFSRQLNIDHNNGRRHYLFLKITSLRYINQSWRVWTTAQSLSTNLKKE